MTNTHNAGSTTHAGDTAPPLRCSQPRTPPRSQPLRNTRQPNQPNRTTTKCFPRFLFSGSSPLKERKPQKLMLLAGLLGLSDPAKPQPPRFPTPSARAPAEARVGTKRGQQRARRGKMLGGASASRGLALLATGLLAALLPCAAGAGAGAAAAAASTPPPWAVGEAPLPPRAPRRPHAHAHSRAAGEGEHLARHTPSRAAFPQQPAAVAGAASPPSSPAAPLLPCPSAWPSRACAPTPNAYPMPTRAHARCCAPRGLPSMCVGGVGDVGWVGLLFSIRRLAWPSVVGGMLTCTRARRPGGGGGGAAARARGRRWTSGEDPTATRNQDCVYKCQAARQVDIAFLLDASGSVGAANYELMKQSVVVR